MYFTEKDQNEKIQELKVEQDFSIDLLLQDGQDSNAEIQLPEGIALTDESLAQEGLTYEENTRTVKVDWTKFTALEQKKRVSLSFTSSLTENASLQAKTVRDGQIYNSQPLNIIPVSSEPASTADDSTGDTESAKTTSASSENATLQAAAAVLDFNETDSYSVSLDGKTLYQIDGSNPTSIKASVQISGDASASANAIALDKNKGFIYVIDQSNKNLYKVAPDGTSSLVTTLSGNNIDNATISGDTYYYITLINGVANLGSYNLTTGENQLREISNSAGQSISGGDIIVDADGLIWYASGDKIAQIDPDTSTLLRVIPIELSDGIAIAPYVRGLSFLPDGQMLISAGNDTVTLFTLNPETLSTKFIGSIQGVEYFSADLASGAEPVFTPNPPVLESNKAVSIQTKADGNTNAENPEVGDTLLYTIKTRNTVENSLVQNLTISDTIPAGLTYVSGSLTVDGQAVTDAEGDDKGHTANGDVVGQFGDVTDNEWHTLTFQVTVNDDQAGQTIPNTAVVKGDNITTPSEPNAEVTISPKEEIDACARPVALINGDFEKPEGPGTYDNSVAGGGYYYADTVPGWKTTDVARTPRGIIQIMDPARPSTIPSNTPNKDNLTSRYGELNADTNSMLYQELPTVPGQTIYWRLNHRGWNGIDTMSVNIGPITADPFNTTPEIKRISTGTTWETYTGTYTVPAGQTMTRFGFKAISTSTGALAFGNYLDDVFLGTEPCVVAEKAVSPEGDVFAGDELTYEVNVKNTGGDIAGNTVFEDAIPEGTEYVPGSLKITNGSGTVDLTDENDDDAGQFDGEKVIVKLGELPNTTNLPDGMTVQFKVKTLATDANKVVTNKALINYDNLLINESQSTETNEVTTTVLPKPVIDACAKPVALINGSFEEGAARGSYNPSWGIYFYESEVPGWKTTDDAQGVKLIEIWNYKEGLPAGAKNFAAPVDGDRWAELNAYENGMLYQDVETTPGQTLYWRLSHMGRHGVDTMQVRIGQATNNPYDTVPQTQMSTGNTAWKTYTGTYTVPAGQTTTRFGFEALSTASGSIGAGNFLDGIFLGTEPCVVAEKTVSPEGEVNAGDELTYEVNVKNNGGDIAADALFEDAIPEGTEYVPGSLKITNGTGTIDLTDADDSDAGHFDGQKVIVKLGDLPNATDLPNGMTVQFKVKTLVSDTITQVKNKAQINYKNLLTNEDEVVDSNETTTPLTYQKPVLDSKKSATIKQKADGNTDTEHPEVGDTLTYTIQTQNTISNSLVKNMTIKDQLPEGLEYVPGTLKVDGKPATDDENDDNGHYVDGTFTGQFGDILDTDVHKIEFEVKVLSGQAGKDIENIATVSGDNLDVPSRPENEVKVYPRLPVLESDKTATNLEAGKEVFEVGDTVVYTIKTRNTVSDGVVEDLKISDTIPAGLTYVAGSLKIDGQSATDADDTDNGYVVNNAVQGTFGDVTDTEWHTVEFQAKINSGQSEQAIKNIATVEGGNITTPDKPEETVNVTPKKPNLVSEKSYTIQEKAAENTDAEHPEVGDTLLYTIKTQNTIEDSLVENMVISDKLPAGLEYVSGSLKVDGVAVSDAEDNDNGHYVDGIFTGQVGDVRDTTEHKIEFLVKVQSGQAGKDIKNIATISGDNLETPDKPETEVKVYPRLPDLESVKEAKNVEEGKNTFEVGDTIEYTIQTRNTVSEGVVENLVISDTIPAGLEYVPGTLKVDGTVVTDSQDGDNGHSVDGKIAGQFGDVTDTEWHTVTFHAKVMQGQAGEVIQNKATVDGDNIDTPDEPTKEVDVNTSDINLSKVADKQFVHVGDIVTYTIEATNAETGATWNGTITDTLPANVELVSGSTELNGAALADGDVWNEGQLTVNPVTVKAGETATITFQVKVLENALNTTIENIATGHDPDQPMVPEETTPTKTEVVPSAGELKSSKAVFNSNGDAIDGQKVKVGDELTYKITAENIKASTTIVNNVKVVDDIPEGLSYVPGTLTVNGEAKDDSAVNGQVVTVDDIGSLKGGEKVEVAFTVTVTEEAKGEITNIATVEGSVPGENPGDPDQPNEPEKPGTDVKVPADIDLSKVADKKTVHVGDIVTYTIEAKNAETGGIWNGTIEDSLPANVELVSGSTTLNGAALADEDVWSEGQLTVSPVTLQAGETAIITFQVKVLESALNTTVENIATAFDPDQPLDPDEPGKDPENPITTPPTGTDVVSSAGELRSAKAVFNSDGEAIDGQKVKVGDQLTYKITTENIKDATTIVNNVKVVDDIPAGLSYVPGTLTVNGEAKDDSAVNGQVVTVADIGSLKGGEKVEVAFTVKVTEDAKGEITNIATVEGTVPGENPGDPDQPNEPQKPGTDVKVPADITLSKVADKKTVHVGDIVTYTIEAKNAETGGVWNGTIEDPLPANVELVSGSTTLNGKALADEDVWSEGQLTVSPVTVKAGETATVTFQVKVLEGALNSTVENIATAFDPDQPLDPDEPGKDPENPITTTPTETEVVSSAGELSSAKAVFNSEGKAIDGQKVKVGDELTYKITAENIKAATTIVNNVKVVDDIPAGLSYVPGTLTVNGEAKDDSAVNGQVVTVDDIGSLKGGEKVEVAFTVKVTAEAKGEITNIATVEGTVPGENPGDPDQPNEPENPGTDVKVPADITLTKVADKKTVRVGEIVTYTIEAKNSETGGVWNGTIQDQLADQVELVANTTKLNGKALTDGDVWSEGQLTVTPVTLQAGETATITFQVKVLESAVSTTVENIATAYDPDQPLDPDEPGKDPSNPITTPPAETEVVPGAGELSSAKAVFNREGEAIEGQKVKVGDQLTYKITAENIKAATTIINNVKVVDNIPEGLSYVPGTLTVNGEAKDDSAVNRQVVTVADIGSLKGGEKVEVAFTVTVTKDATGDITNIATVEGTVPGENPGGFDRPSEPKNSGTKTKLPADITLSKVVDKETVRVGDIVTYTIEAKNGETGGKWNGTIQDQLVKQVELVANTTKLNGKALTDGDVWSEGQLTVSPVTLRAGETATITFQVKVLESAANTTVENIAIAYDPDQPLEPNEPGKDPENPIKTTPTKTKVVPVDGDVPPPNDGDNNNDGTDPVKPDNEPARDPQKLPQTGENQSNYMMIGLLMIGTALIGLLVRRRFVAK
ncbi:isopeptide-forming domain-containing fimbrial protein [Metabacillus niabensis]|uniref:isopeptide-forming domain-containing fimbrial protein n=1 Tax=Metabacillus niabensis TaxID=324854 RepID=UPI001C2E47B1|nr:isopeptide-forming domain-containing fimbrial protein [Metabacillus niabensis]